MAYAGGLPAYRDRCDEEAAAGYPSFDKIPEPALEPAV
jgi:hypothetical protein